MGQAPVGQLSWLRSFEDFVHVPLQIFGMWLIRAAFGQADDLSSPGVKLITVAEVLT